MPPDAEARGWLRFAEDDLKAARAVRREKLYHVACFHAQQAAEKALKSYLVGSGAPIYRDHHLTALLVRCVKAHLRGSGLDRACKILDQYYLSTRYPDAFTGSLEEGLPEDRHASEAIRLAESVLRSVRRSLGNKRRLEALRSLRGRIKLSTDIRVSRKR